MPAVTPWRAFVAAVLVVVFVVARVVPL